jgi:hypothetical protein
MNGNEYVGRKEFSNATKMFLLTLITSVHWKLLYLVRISRRDHLKDLDTDDRIILKCTSKEKDVRVCG